MPRPSIFKPILIAASTVIVVAAMRLAATSLAPILFALFIAALLTPIFRWLKQRMSAALALVMCMGILVLVGAFLLLLVGGSANALAESLACS